MRWLHSAPSSRQHIRDFRSMGKIQSMFEKNVGSSVARSRKHADDFGFNQMNTLTHQIRQAKREAFASKN